MPGLAEGVSRPQKAKNRKHENPSWTRVHGSTTSATHGIYWGPPSKRCSGICKKTSTVNTLQCVTSVNLWLPGQQWQQCQMHCVRSEPSRLTSTSETTGQSFGLFEFLSRWLTAHGPKCPAKICLRRQAFEGWGLATAKPPPSVGSCCLTPELRKLQFCNDCNWLQGKAWKALKGTQNTIEINRIPFSGCMQLYTSLWPQQDSIPSNSWS